MEAKAQWEVEVGALKKVTDRLQFRTGVHFATILPDLRQKCDVHSWKNPLVYRSFRLSFVDMSLRASVGYLGCMPGVFACGQISSG